MKADSEFRPEFNPDKADCILCNPNPDRKYAMSRSRLITRLDAKRFSYSFNRIHTEVCKSCRDAHRMDQRITRNQQLQDSKKAQEREEVKAALDTHPCPKCGGRYDSIHDLQDEQCWTCMKIREFEDLSGTSRCVTCEGPIYQTLPQCSGCAETASEDWHRHDRDQLLRLHTLEQWTRCSLQARNLLLALRNLYGAGAFFPDRPALIRSMLFPKENCDVESVLSELASQGFVRRWSADEYFKFCFDRESSSLAERDEFISSLPGLDGFGPCSRIIRLISEPHLNP